MKTSLLILIASVASAQALDLTPIEAKASGEGGQYTYLEFRDGRSKVSYMPPKTWDYQGAASSLRLVDRDVSSAEADITVRPMKEALQLDEASLKSFEEIARQNLPQGAIKVQTESTIISPLEIDGHKTIEVVMCYNFFGQTIKASSLFTIRECAPVRFRVDAQPSSTAARDATLLIFRTTAPLGEFERMRKIFHSSLNTMAGL